MEYNEKQDVNKIQFHVHELMANGLCRICGCDPRPYQDTDKACYICGSANNIEEHHYDCQRGEISDETVPLCRRCHRTYHDLGIDWFEDEYLDRIISVENKRRELLRLPQIKPEDIKRSNYWYKKHGITPPKIKKQKKPILHSKIPISPALCGEDWLKKHTNDYSVQDIEALTIEIGYNSNWTQPISLANKRSKRETTVKGQMRKLARETKKCK